MSTRLSSFQMWPARPYWAALLVSVLVSLAPISASAALFELEWLASSGGGAPGVNSINASVGDALTLGLYLTPESTGVRAYDITLDYDDEVSAVSTVHTPPPGILPWTTTGPATIAEPAGPLSGQIQNLTALDPTFVGVVGTTRHLLATIVFQVVNNPIADGNDIFIVLNACQNASGGGCSTIINASVNPIPEPTSTLLIALGLASLGLGRRQPGERTS